MIDKNLIHASLESAADKYGDITPMVYRDLFAKHPEAEALFCINGEQYKDDLQKKMVQDSLYGFLEYLDEPEEIDIVLKYTVPQHQSLGVPIKYFSALLQSVADVVCQAADESERAEVTDQWQQVIKALLVMVAHHQD